MNREDPGLRWKVRRFTAPLAEDLSGPRNGAASVRWLGQAGFLIEGGGVRVVVDPYLSNSLEAKYRGSGIPHERMFPAPVSPAALGYVDLVLCTHAHTDHMDPDTLRPLARRLAGLRVVVPAASLSIAESRTGITAPRLIGVDAGETHSLCDDRLKLHVFRAAHETLDCDAQGRHHFLGFGLDIGGRRIFHSGDTIPYLGQREEITAFMPDLALLPVNGRHDALRKCGIAGNLTLEEAVALTGDCGIPAMVPHHYGMFAFNTVDPVQVAEAAARAPFQMIPAQYQQAIEATT